MIENLIEIIPSEMRNAPRWLPVDKMGEPLPTDEMVTLSEALEEIAENNNLVDIRFVVGDGWGEIEYPSMDVMYIAAPRHIEYYWKDGQPAQHAIGKCGDEEHYDLFAEQKRIQITGAKQEKDLPPASFTQPSEQTIITQDPSAPWQPIEKRKALPVFPLERLPQWVQDHINAYTATNGANKDFCVACVLGTVSMITVGHCDIPFNAGHREPIQIYSLFVGRSGTMKSSVIDHFKEPAETYLRKCNAAITKENYIIEKQIEELQKQLSDAKKAGKKAKENNASRIKELSEQLEQKRKEKKNKYPVPWTDVTPESLVKTMQFSRGTANIATAEGNLVNVLTGHSSYNQRGAAPNMDVFLLGTDGHPIHNGRAKDNEEIDIERADVSILLGVQHNLLGRLYTSADSNDRGLSQRFLIYAPEIKRSGINHTVPVSMNQKYMEQWSKHIERIAARFMRPDEKPLLMEMEASADQIIRNFWNYEDDLIDKRGETEEDCVVGWLSKMHGRAIRVSAILALLRDADAGTITAADAENAVALFKDYYIPQFLAAYENPDFLTKEQRQIVNRIIRDANNTGNTDNFTERDLQQYARQLNAFKGKRGIDNFRATLEELRTMNYIRPLSAEKAASGKGRPRKKWQINPDVFKK